MATLSMSVQFPATPPTTNNPPTRGAKPSLSLSLPKPITRNQASSSNGLIRLRAIEKSRESSSEVSSEISSELGSESESSQLGSEIKAAMKEKKVNEEDESLFAGVSREIEKIEWPGFGKVIGTTWVVLGVIAGSSVVLLTLNFVLAELSDKVFAGRGVQDFFG